MDPKATYERDKPKSKNRLAPNPAADEIPKVKGSAKGLFKIVCIIAPPSPKDKPTILAVSTSGKRISNIIVFWISLRFDKSLRAILLSPINKSIVAAIINKIVEIIIFLFLFIFIWPSSF